MSGVEREPWKAVPHVALGIRTYLLPAESGQQSVGSPVDGSEAPVARLNSTVPVLDKLVLEKLWERDEDLLDVFFKIAENALDVLL